MIKKIISYPGFLLHKLTETSLFLTVVSNPIFASISLASIVVFFSFPSYDIAFMTHDMDHNWAAFFCKSKSHSQIIAAYIRLLTMQGN